jgi:two-component system CheB/CheR fusion protein
MAIVLQECLEALGKVGEIQFQIFATDTDREAINAARMGKYPANIAVDVSPLRLERFFTRENGAYQIRQHLRESVIFATHNVIRDPPFTHLDVISCRNLLIYLSPELQKKIIPLFHYALSPGGVLFLGTAESIVGQNDLFGVLESKCRIFQRRDALPDGKGNEMPAVFAVPLSAREVQIPQHSMAKGPTITMIAQEQLLERYAPPAVIVTENGDIVYFHGHTGKYLEPAPGKANLNILAMVRGRIRYSIHSALRNASAEKHEIVAEELAGTNSGPRMVRLRVQPIPKHPGMTDLFLVTFEDVSQQSPLPVQTAEPDREAPLPDIRIAELEQELVDARAQLQHLAEEMQSSRRSSPP